MATRISAKLSNELNAQTFRKGVQDSENLRTSLFDAVIYYKQARKKKLRALLLWTHLLAFYLQANAQYIHSHFVFSVLKKQNSDLYMAGISNGIYMYEMKSTREVLGPKAKFHATLQEVALQPNNPSFPYLHFYAMLQQQAHSRLDEE